MLQCEIKQQAKQKVYQNVPEEQTKSIGGNNERGNNEQQSTTTKYKCCSLRP